MSRDHWDAILASAPLNAIADRVASKGYDYTPAVTAMEHAWDAPPPIVQVGAHHWNNSSFTDLTGLRVGRLTVLGMLDPTGGQPRALWVCRCVCGRYVGRRAKSLKSGTSDRCDLCNYTATLARNASGNKARSRAESPEARKWTTDQSMPPTVKETK